jgi:hypothetical protein
VEKMSDRRSERGKAYVRFSSSLSSIPPSHCCFDEDANLTEEYSLRIYDSETVEVSRRGNSKIMNFEKCFDTSMNNYQVYLEAIEPLLFQCLRGVDLTIFTCEFSVSFPFLT